MSLPEIGNLMREEPALLSVLGRRNIVLAVAEPARAMAIAGLAEMSKRQPIVVAMPTTADATRLARDLATMLGPEEVVEFPAWETLPFERVSPSVETMGRRLAVLWHLRDPERAPRIVVAPVRALVQRLGPGLDEIEPVVVGTGDVIEQLDLVEELVRIGYRRESQVEHRGELAVRGSIVDVFPSTADRPIRIDMWGDEIDRLTEFSVSDQRSTIDISEVEIFGCRELLPTAEVRAKAEELITAEPWGREQWQRLADGQTFDGMESWLSWVTDDETVLCDMLDADAQVLLVEPTRMRGRAEDLAAEEADLAATLAKTWNVPAPDAQDGEHATDLPRLHVGFDRLLALTEAPVWTLSATGEGPDTPTVLSAGWNPVAGDGAPLIKQLKDLLADGYRVIVGADGAGSAERVAALMSTEGVHLKVDLDNTADVSKPGGYVRVAPLERGAILPSVKLAVLGETDVTGRRRTHRAAKAPRRDAQRFFDDLKAGDHVVHHQHGVGRYAGMVTRSVGGSERDYLLIEYRGNDKLYIPSDQIDSVRHYTGGETPSLSRMGGADWQKSKAKVRAAVEEIAQELVVLYQKRITASGHAFAEDTPFQAEMEQLFPFTETPDQLQAIVDVKADMERRHPMDRLICGDVGFGKTEVALRAAFKAVQDGKQVAVLVPTTLLATQHYQTFTERLAPFPVRVEQMSRFLTPKQAKAVATATSEGEVDILIGTHRILSDDVKFTKLGLLIVDEEQRFGVSHKESIKQFKADVDVLTLSATPIPRTLEMSLTGIRDMTLLHTPPAERQPILTYVGEWDERPVAEAIRRELLREGQVFFVHNRVRSIERAADQLRELVPEARIAVAHGQMDEGTLEATVIDFWEGNYDVLVCTTIIESGIDMPTVNTLVVDRADRLGLGQLHQLRGRVGRSGHRAYAYLFTPQDMVLSEDAYERLKTIGETTDLGSGFKIAMRDLEIRGAGNMLGVGQSGHIAAVGYDLYCQMVTEAVAELKGEPIEEPNEVKLELPVKASLDTDYVPSEESRLEAYRRLAAVQTQADVDDIAAEWADRFGPLPEHAAGLIEVARLRAEAVRCGLREVNAQKGPGFGGPAFVARFAPLELKTSQTIRLARLFPDAVYKEESGLLQVPIKAKKDLVNNLVTFLQTLVPPEATEQAA